MRALALGHIAQQPEAAVQVEHKAPVPNRIRQSFIAGMGSCKQSEGAAHVPQLHLSLWDRTPRKRPGGLCLIQVVNRQSIVRACPTKYIPIVTGSDVAIGPCVDQPAAAAEG